MKLVKPKYNCWTITYEYPSIQLSRNKFYILSNYTFPNEFYDGSVTLIDVETYKEYRVAHYHGNIDALLYSFFAEIVEG